MPMTASETAPRDDGGSSSTFDHPPRFATPFAALAPGPISLDWAPAPPHSSSSGPGRTSLVWKGRTPPRRRRAGAGRGGDSAMGERARAVAVAGIRSGGGYNEQIGGATGADDDQNTTAGSSKTEDAPLSDDWVSPRRPHKRVCRRPSPDHKQPVSSPARPPRPGSPLEHSAARPPSQQLLDKCARLPPTAYLHEPEELAFYSDRSRDSSDSDEASIKAPSQPLSDVETSGENQLRRTPPPPRRFARLTLSPIANIDSTNSSTRRDSAPSASTSSASGRSTALRRTSLPSCAALADDLSALRLASTLSSRSGVEHESSSGDECEGASVEDEQGWRFEECPVGSFASTGGTAWW